MVCGINSAGEVFKYVGPPAPAKPPSGSYPWQPITGGHLTQISVGSANNTWGLDSKGNVYRVTASGLTLINGQTLDTISAAADGTVWGLKEFVPYLCEQGPTAETPDNFGSGANYILGDPHRKILRDVRVTIEITEDLVTEPKEKDIKNYSPKFAFQLNANSSANPSVPEDTWIVWQQYIFGIGDVIQGPSTIGLLPHSIQVTRPSIRPPIRWSRCRLPTVYQRGTNSRSFWETTKPVMSRA